MLTYLLYAIGAVAGLVTLIAAVLLSILGYWILMDKYRLRKQEQENVAGDSVS
jgi:hypothetical protein